MKVRFACELLGNTNDKNKNTKTKYVGFTGKTKNIATRQKATRLLIRFTPFCLLRELCPTREK